MFRYKSWCFVSLATPLHWKAQQIASPTFKVWSSSWTVSTIVTPGSREAESMSLLYSRLAALLYWCHLGHTCILLKYGQCKSDFYQIHKVSNVYTKDGFDSIIWIVCPMLYHPLTKTILEWMYFIVNWHNALKTLQFFIIYFEQVLCFR